MAIGHYTPETRAERSGEIHQKFVFGEVRTSDPDYQREARELTARARAARRAVDPKAMIELAKRYQPYKPDSREPVDPKAPLKQFPLALRNYLVKELSLKKDDILFWTMVGSLADTELGADGIMEIRKPSGQSSVFIRLDLSIDRFAPVKKRLKSYEIVMIYGEIPDVHYEKAAFDTLVQKTGEDIIQKLKLAQYPVAK